VSFVTSPSNWRGLGGGPYSSSSSQSEKRARRELSVPPSCTEASRLPARIFCTFTLTTFMVGIIYVFFILSPLPLLPQLGEVTIEGLGHFCYCWPPPILPQLGEVINESLGIIVFYILLLAFPTPSLTGEGWGEAYFTCAPAALYLTPFLTITILPFSMYLPSGFRTF